MKTDLGTGYIIEGFDSRTKAFMFKDELCIVGEKLPYIYFGRVCEITEEFAKDIVNTFYAHYYMNYIIKSVGWYDMRTAKESIQSACNQEYCIIYKKK